MKKYFPCQKGWLIRYRNLKILQGRRKGSKNKLLFETIPFAKYATENWGFCVKYIWQKSLENHCKLAVDKKMVGAKRNFGSLDLTNGVRRQTFRSKDIEKRNDNLNHKRLHDLTQFLSSHDKNLSYHLKAFHRHPI